MDDDRGGKAAVAAGAIAGIAGLLSFLFLHHAWIAPIWFIAPVGAVMAALGGAAVGAAYAELAPRLPPRPLTWAAMAGLWAGVLLPAVFIAQLRGPVVAMGPDGGGTLLVPVPEAIVDVVVGLVGATAIAGAVLGALVGRTRRSAGTTMLAAGCLAIGPGHNIPLLGGSAAVPTELAILAIVLAVASIVLVEVDVRLTGARRVEDVGAITAMAAHLWPRGTARLGSRSAGVTGGDEDVG